jgi:RHS repeat-associated protein
MLAARWLGSPSTTRVPIRAALSHTCTTTAAVFAYNLRFPGQYYDQETGKHYNYYRDFDPGLGRYLESDPIGLRSGNNTYAYADQNPLELIDRWGLDATVWPPGPGRSVSDGARNGNWCGGNWSGGQVPSLNGGKDGTKPPVDSLDRCCMAHDQCFGNCDAIPAKGPKNKCMYDCNRDFVGCMQRLGDNCSKWPEPPRSGTEGDTQRYRGIATWYFTREMRNWEKENARR